VAMGARLVRNLHRDSAGIGRLFECARGRSWRGVSGTWVREGVNAGAAFALPAPGATTGPPRWERGSINR